MEFWSEKIEEKLIELWKKYASLYDIDQSLQRPCKISSGARKLRADWLYAVQLGQLHCRSSATVELRRRVELSCVAIYKRALIRVVYMQQTSTSVCQVRV